MKVEITHQQYNPLLKRQEILFTVEHSQTKGTPTRLEVRNSLADMLKANPDAVYVKRIMTKSGTMTAAGEANAYDSVEQANLVEAKYIIARHMQKEKKEAAEKPEAPPKPPVKEPEQPTKKEG